MQHAYCTSAFRVWPPANSVYQDCSLTRGEARTTNSCILVTILQKVIICPGKYSGTPRFKKDSLLAEGERGVQACHTTASSNVVRFLLASLQSKSRQKTKKTTLQEEPARHTPSLSTHHSRRGTEETAYHQAPAGEFLHPAGTYSALRAASCQASRSTR